MVGARWATFVSSFCTAPPRAGAWQANAPLPWFVGVRGRLWGPLACFGREIGGSGPKLELARPSIVSADLVCEVHDSAFLNQRLFLNSSMDILRLTAAAPREAISEMI